METLDQIGSIDDRGARLEQLKVYVQSHPGDGAGWFMLHLEQDHAGHRDAADVARARALALDPLVARRFQAPDEVAEHPGAGAPHVPGFRVVRVIHEGSACGYYDAIDEHSGEHRTLRVLRGERIDSARRQLSRQLVARRYRGCVPALDVIPAEDGRPVQVLVPIAHPPLEAHAGPIAPAQARAAVAALARALVPVHADGLIAGDLRPGTVVGDLAAPATLSIVGVRQPEGETFGTLAGDPDRLVWFVPEEGRGHIDARADICGLGLLLWHLVTGERPPYLGKRLQDGMPPTGDAALDAIIARATRLEPGERHGSVLELADELAGAAATTTLDGDRAGDWILHERIGGGSVADVYRATHVVDARRAVVKVFQRRIAFEREARTLAMISHPGVVRLLEASSPTVAQPFLALELAHGETLSTRLEAGPLDVATAIEIARQLAAALGALHGAGVLHRDVKPDNVIVGDVDGRLRVTLIDLDSAHLRAEPELEDPDLSGTASHMAPEQWQLARDLDPRTDVYGLGLLIYECLFGRHPLGAPDSLAAWRRAHCDGPSPIVPARPELSEHRRALIERMIAHDRARRPRSMAEVLDLLDHEPRPPARWPWLAIGATGLVLAGGAVAAVVIHDDDDGGAIDAGTEVVVVDAAGAGGDVDAAAGPGKTLSWCWARAYTQEWLDQPKNQDQDIRSMRVALYGVDGDEDLAMIVTRRRRDGAGAWRDDPRGWQFHTTCGRWLDGQKPCGPLTIRPNRAGGYYVTGLMTLVAGDGETYTEPPDTYWLDTRCP